MGPYDAQFLDLRKNPELMKSISEFAERFILLHDRSPYTSEIAEALGVARVQSIDTWSRWMNVECFNIIPARRWRRC